MKVGIPIVRPATESDAEDIARVHVETWKVAYREQVPDEYLEGLAVDDRVGLWRTTLENGETVLVSELSQEVVGFCHIVPSRDRDAANETGEITSLYVHPDAWRNGVGWALAKRGMTEGIGRGYQDLTLWVLASNVGARAFYEALGFRADGARKLEERPGFRMEEVRYCLPLRPKDFEQS